MTDLAPIKGEHRFSPAGCSYLEQHAIDLELATAALAYASRGWPVLPLAGKVPRTRNGLKDASTDRAELARWWSLWPDAGVGIRTGRESGLIVLDVDPEHGGDETLAELELRHGRLPETASAETGGGGEHFYFQHPGGVVANTAGKLGPGLDTRADGGYVVAAPSLHPSGGRYTWDREPEAGIAEPPAWLLAAAGRRRDGKQRPPSAWRELAAGGAGEGARNHSAAALAGHLLARRIDPYVALELVVAWDQVRNRPPLGRAEIERVVDSIARREAAKWTA